MAKKNKTAVIKDVFVMRTLYGTPFQDAICDHCGEKSSSETKCPFCNYPRDVEFIEGEENV